MPAEARSKSAMPLPLGSLEHLISECPLPNTAVIPGEIQTTQRGHVEVFVNCPAGYSLQGTTLWKPDL